ncbi:tannase and feruloyl esterase [Hysterangium stoloniferum]|nr:tannase and feruloyl esterase [Hysterangium stoloniferum]
MLRLLKFLISSFFTIRGRKYDCLDLTMTLTIANTTILEAQYVASGETISTYGSCQSAAVPTSSTCRVLGVVSTSSTSNVHFEMWLPDTWFGRFLGVGNGGLGGCIDYAQLDYGNTMHFATIGSDNGHDGESGLSFLNNPEVINDFTHRAIHVEAVVGKQIIEAYYKKPHSKSYYLGCSTGGRQGIQSALLFPDDFDGIVAGAPAVDFNHLLGWTAMLNRFVGAPNPENSPTFIPLSLWPSIAQEIMDQCDSLDGLKDAIITEPDDCDLRLQTLACEGDMGNTDGCLTTAQLEALDKIYSPLLGTQRQVLYPRYDPGSEADGDFAAMFNGSISSIPADWERYAVQNNASFSFADYSIADVEYTSMLDLGGVSTWNGSLTSFRERGGKIITYHGRRDPGIASGISKRLHALVSTALSSPSHPNIDDFYRLFLIPGMGHCSGGQGAWAFGQGLSANVVNDTEHNVLLAIVDWIESEDFKAPERIVGSTVPVDGGEMVERVHCRYPQRSVWDVNGDVFGCV